MEVDWLICFMTYKVQSTRERDIAYKKPCVFQFSLKPLHFIVGSGDPSEVQLSVIGSPSFNDSTGDDELNTIFLGTMFSVIISVNEL